MAYVSVTCSRVSTLSYSYVPINHQCAVIAAVTPPPKPRHNFHIHKFHVLVSIALTVALVVAITQQDSAVAVCLATLTSGITDATGLIGSFAKALH
jgi:hypothetical protein